jgi:hypothetical protein
MKLIEITAPRAIIVKSTQIQYSQQVFLNFNILLGRTSPWLR